MKAGIRKWGESWREHLRMRPVSSAEKQQEAEERLPPGISGRTLAS